MSVRAFTLLSVAACALAQSPSIVNEGNNLVVQTAATGDVSFRMGTTTNTSIGSMLTRLAALEQRLTAMESSALPQNVTTIQYTSNLSPQYAATNNLQNDVTFLVGRFATSQSLSISVEDRGPCAGFSMRFTVVARWGTQLGNDPQIYSAGAADSRRHSLVQWYYVGANPGYYYLWLYMPPWPTCGLGGTTPQTHTLTVSTELSSNSPGVTFTPAADAAAGLNPLNLPNGGAPPPFNYNSGNASNIIALTTQIHASETDLVPAINGELNRAQLQVRWSTNMEPSYAQTNGISNDLRLLVGKFQTRAVLTATVSDVGACSNFGQDFTIVGKWGVHLTPANNPTANHPEVFSFGVSSDWNVHINAYQWYFKANGTDLYYLWLYIPPFPVCGTSGQQANWHTATVTVQSSTSVDQYWVNNQRPVFNVPQGNVLGAPAFDYPEVQNASGITNMPTQIITSDVNVDQAFTSAVNTVLKRTQMTYRWASNMNQTYANANNFANNLGTYIGRMSVNSVVTLSISDSGWCSGTAIEYKVMGRWGVHFTNYTSTRPNSDQYAPVPYAIGHAQGDFAGQRDFSPTDIFNLYFSPVSSAGNTAHLYNLFLYIPAFPMCGSRDANNVLGGVPRYHTTVVTVQVDGQDTQAIFNGTTSDNDGNTLAFDYFGANTSNIMPMVPQVLDPSNSDTFAAMVSKSVNRYSTSYTYTSNMADTSYSIPNQNNLVTTLGQFSTSSAVEITLEDVGWCSGMAMNFLLLGRWGVHQATTTNTNNHPEIFTWGSATEWLFNPRNQAFQFFFTPVLRSNGTPMPNRFWLYLLIKPWPVCGAPSPQQHTATVTMTVSNAPSGGLTYEQMFMSTDTPPTMDYYGANTSNILLIPAQITAPL